MTARHLRLVTELKPCFCDACLALALDAPETQRMKAAIADLLEAGPMHTVKFLLVYGLIHDSAGFTKAVTDWNRHGHIPVEATRQ